MDVTTTAQKARKRHGCEVCPVPILPGEHYTRQVTFDDSVTVWKLCDPCKESLDLAFLDGYDDGGMITADMVHEWAEERQDTDDRAAALIHRLRHKEHAP